MTAQPLPQPKCAACGAVVTDGAARCDGCGLRRPTATGPGVLTRSPVLVLAAILLAVWVVVLLVVASAR
jgi:hypothetical protein